MGRRRHTRIRVTKKIGDGTYASVSTGLLGYAIAKGFEKSRTNKAKIKSSNIVEKSTSNEKDKNVTIILCCLGFIGLGGIHDFYLGNIGAGIIKLFTWNWFFIGTIIDLIRISKNEY